LHITAQQEIAQHVVVAPILGLLVRYAGLTAYILQMSEAVIVHVVIMGMLEIEKRSLGSWLLHKEEKIKKIKKTKEETL